MVETHTVTLNGQEYILPIGTTLEEFREFVEFQGFDPAKVAATLMEAAEGALEEYTLEEYQALEEPDNGAVAKAQRQADRRERRKAKKARKTAPVEEETPVTEAPVPEPEAVSMPVTETPEEKPDATTVVGNPCCWFNWQDAHELREALPEKRFIVLVCLQTGDEAGQKGGTWMLDWAPWTKAEVVA